MPLHPSFVRKARFALGRMIGGKDADKPLSRAQFGSIFGLPITDGGAKIEEWESEGPPDEVTSMAITYLSQGLVEGDLKAIIPEHIFGRTLGAGGDRDANYVVRLWWPRFAALSLPADVEVTGDWAWIVKDVEKLAVMAWIDDPDHHPSRSPVQHVQRAATLLNLEKQEFEEKLREMGMIGG